MPETAPEEKVEATKKIMVLKSDNMENTLTKLMKNEKRLKKRS